jgi:hypothetical protein
MPKRLWLARVHGVSDQRLHSLAAKGLGMGDLPRARGGGSVADLRRAARGARYGRLTPPGA